MTTCLKIFVTGKVQGVFFRASTAREAKSLGITGRAINLADGRVEVLACGEPAATEQLRSWLEVGPTAARVDGIEVTQVECEPPATFTTG